MIFNKKNILKLLDHMENHIPVDVDSTSYLRAIKQIRFTITCVWGN